MCCDTDGQFEASWNPVDNVFVKMSPASDESDDAVWRIKSVCGCGNLWVDTDGGFPSERPEYDQAAFTNQFLCPNDRAAFNPCDTAIAGLATVTGKIGCCAGEVFLSANSRCVGAFSDQDNIDFSAGKTLKRVGPNFKGKYLRHNFIPGGMYRFQPVSSTSHLFYNQAEEVVDAYCGKSSAFAVGGGAGFAFALASALLLFHL